MPSLRSLSHSRQAFLIALLSLVVVSLGWALDSTPPPPPVGTPLPAAGANQEPVPDATKAKDTAKKPEAPEADEPLPPLKPIEVHAERDAEIGHLVDGMIEENHYLQTPVTPEMSQRWLKNYFQALDPSHLFFLKSDIDEFTTKYGNNLGNLIRGDNEKAAVAPAFEIFNRYMERLDENITLAEKLLHDKFDFTKTETFTIRTDKSPWMTDEAMAKAVWRGQVKSDLLNGLLEKKTPESTIKRVGKRYRSLLLDRLGMEDMDVIELYLAALANAYDPHSVYFQPEEAENFTIQSIKLAVTGIGAILRSDDGYATIEELIPGGPADIDKRLQAGDRIVAVGQGTTEPVDTVNMKLNKVVEMIRGQKGSKVHLVVLPAGASDSAVHKDIVLTRDVVNIKESHAKAEIIEHPLPGGGTTKIGVITLPGFYGEAATDVAKLIQRLKREDVSGIILDVRNNGGGLLDQAVDLTGLFAKRAPVVQIRRSDGYVDQLGSDITPIYSGPLVVMVNKASASATEIVAGALQDYGRAIIVGDQSTHGKGTVQTLIPLQDRAPIGFVGDPGKLKLTIQKFYRVAGGSTQQKGVIPDIVLPSVLDALQLGEATLPYCLPYDTVPAANFDYLNLTADYLPKLREKSSARVAASPDFAYVKQDIDFYKKKIVDSTVSLNLDTREKEREALKTQAAQRKKDLLARQASRDKMLEITMDMVDQNLPAAPPVAKKPKTSEDPDADPDAPDLDSTINNPTDDPQLDEAVNIMIDYTAMLRDAGSKLVQSPK